LEARDGVFTGTSLASGLRSGMKKVGGKREMDVRFRQDPSCKTLPH
jgi:hypothetical protein